MKLPASGLVVTAAKDGALRLEFDADRKAPPPPRPAALTSARRVRVEPTAARVLREASRLEPGGGS